MFRLRSVDVLSSAKILAAIHGVLGILIGFALLVVGVAGVFGARGQGKLPMIGLMGLAVVAPLLYAGIGFVAGAVWALVYNLAAQYMGGLKLQLDLVSVGKLEPPPSFAGQEFDRTI